MTRVPPAPVDDSPDASDHRLIRAVIEMRGVSTYSGLVR